ncbi:ABC transporter permease [Glutamicibacter endophyticus]|uniref:ABC transporter permease n=1 Tax=Glutamicibacter endophyticus TaxID=1522174 RepID=UPI003AEF6F55
MAADFSVADRAVGLGSPIDVKNAAIGDGAEPVPAWAVIGDITAVVHLESGRYPGPGEALVSTTALAKLGMQQPVGAVEISNTKLPVDYAIVGSYTPLDPFDDMAQGVVFEAPIGSTATNLHLILRDASQAAVAQRSVIGLFGQLQDPESISVHSPIQLAQLHDEIVGDLGAFGRSMLYGSIGIGALLVAVVVFADILVRRKDLGRRRALGAARSDIIQLMLLRTLIPAVLGTLSGVIAGLGITIGSGTTPPMGFCIGVLVLALFAAGVSTLVPAAYAAHADPVKVLRTP